MSFGRRRRRRSNGVTPLLVAAILVLAALVIADRLQVLPWQGVGGTATNSPTGSSSIRQTAGVEIPVPPTATSTPTPTATPIPAPVKKTDAPPPFVSAVGAVAIDERSGAVLYEKDAHLRRAPASITKIVTALVAIERGNVDDIVDVTYDASQLIDSTVMGVNPGDKASLEDLLYGLMLPSGNEAALAIANHVAGSERAFVDLMNAKMAELRLEDSHFANPHGLDARGHYSSAYDMAMVSRFAMRYPLFRQLSSTKVRAVTVWRPKEKQSYDIFNLNKLLWVYPGADGVKVGFTENAGRTIVGSAVKDGRRVYVALMGSTDLWTDTPRVLDYVFSNFAWPAGY